ncbi:MAG TPA: hypothetical protein VGB15_06175, partial [Longimicrobium sp.]
RDAAIAHYGAASRAGSFEFKLYRDKAVKEALVRLFRGKCAYCETPYAAAHPVDVEHWRPKGDVEEEDGTKAGKGYYWLAAEWSNLLPSCIDCNRRRAHLIPGRAVPLVVGKGNAFPLVPGSQRRLEPGSEAGEATLLLNPCRDDADPAEVLEWNVDEAVIVPRTNAAGEPDPRGVASIHVYALNRTELVQARREVLHLMRQHMYVIGRLSELLAMEPPVPDGVREIVLDLMQHEAKALKEFANPNRAYSFFASAVIRDFETRQLELP